MKKILFVCALSQELNVVKEKTRWLFPWKLEMRYFTTWMWSYTSMKNLMDFLFKHSEKNSDGFFDNEFDFVVNLWICWYIDEYLPYFQVARIVELWWWKEQIVPQFIDFCPKKSICCSEKEIFYDDELKWEKYVDMESYWIEWACSMMKVPVIILKVPYDDISLEKEKKELDFYDGLELLRENIDYKKLLEMIIHYLDTIPEKKDFSKYFNAYRFSFSDKENFKKLYYRYKALVWEEFDIYFDENKGKNRKVFLADLEDFLEEYIIK